MSSLKCSEGPCEHSGLAVGGVGTLGLRCFAQVDWKPTGVFKQDWLSMGSQPPNPYDT